MKTFEQFFESKYDIDDDESSHITGGWDFYHKLISIFKEDPWNLTRVVYEKDPNGKPKDIKAISLYPAKSSIFHVVLTDSYITIYIPRVYHPDALIGNMGEGDVWYTYVVKDYIRQMNPKNNPKMEIPFESVTITIDNGSAPFAFADTSEREKIINKVYITPITRFCEHYNIVQNTPGTNMDKVIALAQYVGLSKQEQLKLKQHYGLLGHEEIGDEDIGGLL
jgi:hypothetical protein